MPQPPNKKPDIDPNWAEDQRERAYYYDDSHGYETYDPEKDDEDLGSGVLDVDLDRTPPLLIEPQEAQEESREVPDEDRDPDI